MRRRINILQANLLSVQHYKLQFITTTSSSTAPTQSTSSNDTQRTQWTAVSESSTTPSFSSEGYQFSLSPNTTTTPTNNNNTLYHSSISTSKSSNTHLYISLYQCPTRDGEYTLAGSTVVPVDATPSSLPVSLFKTKHHTHPSELFASLCTIVQDATVDAAFRKHLGKKKSLLRDYEFHTAMFACDRLTHIAALSTELNRLATLYEIPNNSTTTHVLYKAVKDCVHQARIRLADLFATFVKKKSKKLIKTMVKKRAAVVAAANKQKKKANTQAKAKKKTTNGTAQSAAIPSYSIDTHGGELFIQISKVVRPSYSELLAKEASGAGLLNDLQESYQIEEEDATVGETKKQGGGRVFVVFHGIKPSALVDERVRMEGRVLTTAQDSLVRTKFKISKGKGYDKYLDRLSRVLARVETSSTSHSTNTTSGGTSSLDTTGCFLSIPYDEYDNHNDTILRLDVMNAKDAADPWPSRGGVSIPIRRLMPDIQYDLSIDGVDENSDIGGGATCSNPVDSMSISVMLTQTKEERLNHGQNNRGTIRPEMIQLHLSKLLHCSSLYNYSRIIGVVSLLTKTQIRQFRQYKRKNTMGGGDADQPPFKRIQANALLGSTNGHQTTTAHSLLHQKYPVKCEELNDMRATSIVHTAWANGSATTSPPSPSPSPSAAEKTRLDWTTTLSFPLNSGNNVDYACIEIYCDEFTEPRRSSSSMNAAHENGIVPSVSLGHFMLDLSVLQNRTDGSTVVLPAATIVLDQPLNDPSISTLEIETYGRRWCGESYGAVSPKYMNPAAILTAATRSMSIHSVKNRNGESGKSGKSGETGDAASVAVKQTHRNHENNNNSVTTTIDAINTDAMDPLPPKKQSLYAFQSEETLDDEPSATPSSFPTNIDAATTQAVVAMQARARGCQARERVVGLLMVDRRVRTLKKRASLELSGLEDIKELSLKFQDSEKKLKKSILVRNECMKKMKEAEKERVLALEMMEEMQTNLDDATFQMKQAEERLKSAEDTIIGCDEMLVDKDKKVSKLETELKILKDNNYASPSRRSPPLLRGTGGGGGAGNNNSTAQPTPLEKELEEKNILVERLSAKLEHSEYIIQQMIQANAGAANNNGGFGGARGGRVPQVRGRGGGKLRRRRYELADDDY